MIDSYPDFFIDVFAHTDNETSKMGALRLLFVIFSIT